MGGNKSPVASRGTEVTLVANFPRPTAWGARGKATGDAAEIAVMKTGKWHPTVDDFMEVAQVPSTGQKRRLTEIFTVDNVGEMLGAILDLGSGNKARRKKHSIKRLNLISHGIAQLGKPALYGLGGTIADNGDCSINLSVAETPQDPNGPMRGGLDESVLNWLDTTAKSLRDDCRARFREDGEIGLVLCNSGGVPLGFSSQQLMPKLGQTFNVRVRGFDDEIYYDNTFDGAKNRFTDRNQTKIGRSSSNPSGIGYFCEVKVAARFAGKHLEFNKSFAKPTKPTP
ncbi:MAG: hypothetical protein A2V88_17905 [Elusimicrobia bacterium RBG_16_66_12]|nr:MAG: hypothetical protein A2V88_17905 [Elusimicrobia bacterium RBG_16_66_12]